MLKNECGLMVEARMERSVPCGEFIAFKHDENHAMTIKIEVCLPRSLERNLVKCCKANTDLFIVSLDEVPDIDPYCACH